MHELVYGTEKAACDKALDAVNTVTLWQPVHGFLYAAIALETAWMLLR